MHLFICGLRECEEAEIQSVLYKGLSLPAHMAVIRKEHDRPFDLAVWLKKRSFKVVFEMHYCGRNT